MTLRFENNVSCSWSAGAVTKAATALKLAGEAEETLEVKELDARALLVEVSQSIFFFFAFARYVALPLCAWNWPSTSDVGVRFVGISFPNAGYLCVAGTHKFSSSVRVGIFKFHV